MASAKRAGRVSTAKMQPAQATREQIIASMIISGGMTNDQVWGAFEAQDPRFIKPDDVRRKAKLVDIAYDHEERQKLGRAIRSVRGLAQKAAGDTAELLEVLGEGETRQAKLVDYENIKRWDCGDPVMNNLYGQTEYVWLLPQELKGHKNPATGLDWEYGDEIPKRFLKYLDPMTGLPAQEEIGAVIKAPAHFGDKTGFVEVGVPVSFVDTWGGEKGVGKSRLAIAVEKSTCFMQQSRAVVHNYGESNLAQLRQWIGPKAPDNLIIGERKSFSQIIADIYKYKPILYVQDSLQSILEAQTTRGMKEVLATFKQLATEEAAGKPHIIGISQLNAKGTLKGSTDLGHIVDFVSYVRKRETRKGVFYFLIDKNRGGESGGSADYQHTSEGVVCLGFGSKNKPRINLRQATDPAIQQGVSNPAALPEDGGEDIQP